MSAGRCSSDKDDVASQNGISEAEPARNMEDSAAGEFGFADEFFALWQLSNDGPEYETAINTSFATTNEEARVPEESQASSRGFVLPGWLEESRIPLPEELLTAPGFEPSEVPTSSFAETLQDPPISAFQDAGTIADSSHQTLTNIQNMDTQIQLSSIAEGLNSLADFWQAERQSQDGDLVKLAASIDRTMPKTPGQQSRCRRQLYVAWRDCRQASNFKEGLALRKQPVAYQRLVQLSEAAHSDLKRYSWDLLYQLIHFQLEQEAAVRDATSRGFSLKLPNGKTFQDRFDIALEGMREQKELCKNMLDHTFITRFAQDPVGMTRRTERNKKGNDTKWKLIKAGQAAVKRKQESDEFDEDNEEPSSEPQTKKHKSETSSNSSFAEGELRAEFFPDRMVVNSNSHATIAISLEMFDFINELSTHLADGNINLELPLPGVRDWIYSIASGPVHIKGTRDPKHDDKVRDIWDQVRYILENVWSPSLAQAFQAFLHGNNPSDPEISSSPLDPQISTIATAAPLVITVAPTPSKGQNNTKLPAISSVRCGNGWMAGFSPTQVNFTKRGSTTISIKTHILNFYAATLQNPSEVYTISEDSEVIMQNGLISGDEHVGIEGELRMAILQFRHLTAVGWVCTQQDHYEAFLESHREKNKKEE
ncbi:MAG: hypothetical protein M1814_006107 [Vezdaea aestivalis]|nr:MAG: hypothetical protein M1814_006107 [Vezdaea aestivalis]